MNLLSIVTIHNSNSGPFNFSTVTPQTLSIPLTLLLLPLLPLFADVMDAGVFCGREVSFEVDANTGGGLWVQKVCRGLGLGAL